MASRLVAAAAAASSSSSPPLARLVTRRGLAGTHIDQPWTPNPNSWRVNLWEDPWSPMRWKDSHFVVATLTVWGSLVFGGFKLFGGKKENKEKVADATEE